MGGGTARRVLERIGRLADGWIARSAPGLGLEEAWAVIVGAAREAGRDANQVGLQGLVEPREDPGEERLRRQLERWGQFEPTTHLAISGLHAGRGPREHVEYVKRAGGVIFG